MGFNMLFYIIFGTNLLSGGLVPVFVFLPILEFRRKGISNGIQPEWNLHEDLFLEQTQSRRLGVDVKKQPRRPRGCLARPRGVGAPPYLVASCFVSWRRVQVSLVLFVEKITFPKVSFRLDCVWYSFSAKHWNRQKNNNLGWASG